MIILRYIALYIIILLGSTFFVDKFKKKMESCIIVYLLSAITTIYIFGIFNILNIGIWITTIISIILGIATIIKNVKNKTIKELKENIFTIGTLFFTIIFFIFIITTAYRKLTHWDQYSYWSYATKDMYNTGKLIIKNNINFQYPPMPAILQVFFMRIIGCYSQGIEIFTTWILGFSMLIPLFDKSNFKKISNIAIVAIILCLPAIFSMIIFYESSYPDTLLGLLIGHLSIIYFYEKDEKFKNLLIILGMVVISLTKPTGFVIAGILATTFFIYELMTNKEKVTGFIKSSKIRKILLYILIVILTYLSWQVCIKVYSSNDITTASFEEMKGEKSQITYLVKSFFTTTLGYYQENNDAAQSNGSLIAKMYNTKEIYTPIEVSAAGTIFIFLIIFILLYKYEKNENKYKFKKMIIAVIIGLILYILFLQVAYLLKFSTKEMLAHDGFERYIGTYLLGITYIITFIILDKIKNKRETSSLPYVILAAAIILITPINSIANATITAGIYNINNQEYLYKENKQAEYIKSKTEESDKILGICQRQELRLKNLIIRYYMYPLKYEVIDKINEDIEDFEEIIKEYNYIYVIYTDDYFGQIANKYLTNEQQIEEDTLYKIENDNENIKLEKMN